VLILTELICAVANLVCPCTCSFRCTESSLNVVGLSTGNQGSLSLPPVLLLLKDLPSYGCCGRKKVSKEVVVEAKRLFSVESLNSSEI